MYNTHFVKCGLFYPAKKRYAFAVLSDGADGSLHSVSCGKKGKWEQQASGHENLGQCYKSLLLNHLASLKGVSFST